MWRSHRLCSTAKAAPGPPLCLDCLGLIQESLKKEPSPAKDSGSVGTPYKLMRTADSQALQSPNYKVRICVKG